MYASQDYHQASCKCYNVCRSRGSRMRSTILRLLPAGISLASEHHPCSHRLRSLSVIPNSGSPLLSDQGSSSCPSQPWLLPDRERSRGSQAWGNLLTLLAVISASVIFESNIKSSGCSSATSGSRAIALVTPIHLIVQYLRLFPLQPRKRCRNE